MSNNKPSGFKNFSKNIAPQSNNANPPKPAADTPAKPVDPADKKN